MKKPERSDRLGFTLVELLVVMAIISVLAGLLLPVLSDALRAARRASCQGNERQIGLGMQMYVNDYEGRIPIKDQDRWWVTHRYDLRQGRLSRTARLHYGGYLRDPEVWFCPAAIFKGGGHWTYDIPELKRRLAEADVDAGENPVTRLGYAGNSGGAGGLPTRLRDFNKHDVPATNLIFSGCTFHVGVWSTHTSGGYGTLVDGVNALLLDASVHWFPNRPPHMYNHFESQYTERNTLDRSIWHYAYVGGQFVRADEVR